jgi:F0F1-type ATP synthase gamma subunit
VRARITGTQNIAKITKSMKMVSASKLRGDSQRLKAADPFSVIGFFNASSNFRLQ